MIRSSLIVIIVLCFSSLSYAESTDKAPEQELTPEQKKELATVVGIILPDMTKEEVLKTLGEPRKTGFSASTGQEVWYYKSPEEQIIYFLGDEVDRVRYLPEKKVEVKDVEWL